MQTMHDPGLTVSAKRHLVWALQPASKQRSLSLKASNGARVSGCDIKMMSLRFLCPLLNFKVTEDFVGIWYGIYVCQWKPPQHRAFSFPTIRN